MIRDYRVATLAAALLLGASVASGGGSAPLSPLSLLPPPKGSRFGGAGDIEGSYDVFFGRFDEKAFIAAASSNARWRFSFRSRTGISGGSCPSD